MGRRTKFSGILGALKDKASLSKAALLSKPNLHLAVLRATTHEPSSPPHEKHVAALLSFGNNPRNTASICIEALMNRLQSTHNSCVALKCLITIHNIIRRGTFILQDQLSIYPSTGGRNYLNLSNFRDDSCVETWVLSSWVRWYARVLEQFLLTSRLLGFFLCSSEKYLDEEKISTLLNCDLVKELDVLVGIIEEICRAPELVLVRENKLVKEVMRLVDEDYQTAQNEIFIRFNEVKERLGYLNFGESVELVCVLKRLMNCKERLLLLFSYKKVAIDDTFWGLMKEMVERIGKVKEYEEGRMVVRKGRGDKGPESARFGDRIVRSGELVVFSSGRLDLRSFSSSDSCS